MQQETIKANKIVSEVLDILQNIGYHSLNFSIVIEPESTLIRMEGILLRPIDDLKPIQSDLNVPRVPEYEDYYLELLGNGADNPVRILGYMIDEANIETQGCNIILDLIRKK